MYPVTQGLDSAQSNIDKLLTNGHSSEALLTSIFTFEKMLHRTLKQIIISSGFKNKDATKIMKQFQGLHNQKKVWEIFDPHNRSLIKIIGESNWNTISNASKMRNKLVHGVSTFNLIKCANSAESILNILADVSKRFNETYGYDGWSRVTIRKKSTLHADPTLKKDKDVVLAAKKKD